MMNPEYMYTIAVYDEILFQLIKDFIEDDFAHTKLDDCCCAYRSDGRIELRISSEFEQREYLQPSVADFPGMHKFNINIQSR